jgi:hypothetical protein
MYSNGCECVDEGRGKACTNPTGVAPVGLGASINIGGNLPLMGMENWFQVTFNGNSSDKNYHPKVFFNSNPGNAFQLDVVSSCNPGAYLTCDDGHAQGVQTWEVSYTGGDPNSDFKPIPSVGTILIRVYYRGGPQRCEGFGLTISS